MLRKTAFLLLTIAGPVLAAKPIQVGENDWPWWRGPSQNGIASPDQDPPLSWSESENIAWKAKVPGRGHGAPIVVGDRVYLATGDRERKVQSILCYSRSTGEQIWESIVHRGGLMSKNKKASEASSTIACDGRSLFINFLNDGVVYTTALDLNGEQLWQTEITRYVVHQGYGSSPALYQSLVLVSADNKQGGAVAAPRPRDRSSRVAPRAPRDPELSVADRRVRRGPGPAGPDRL